MADVLLYDHPGSICSQMARLALAEKGVVYTRRSIDIMRTAEQFQPWYVALNPKAVVPTLRIGDEIVTETIRIVTRVDAGFDGPPLSLPDSETVQDWLRAIMGLHYGVLLYSEKLEADRTSPTIIERGHLLVRLRDERPELAELLGARIEGNTRFQSILRDPGAVEGHIDAARDLVARMNRSLESHEFLAGDAYSLADCFATAALARFRIHGFARWWEDGRNSAVAVYYGAMKSRASFTGAAVVDSGSERDL